MFAASIGGGALLLLVLLVVVVVFLLGRVFGAGFRRGNED